ncbi:sodium/hydrogen exchanger family protein [Hirsutella rhossiliensis]|uniref:Sodium/hydrogen exchanger family domain-containing protein n=1 Tax=Hirsutella rhossiliensis TaxID=111463 RepID=A0A9P8N6P8_9HYPO|nr:sodium/hydrogen exchanger family domain-containing protein [Hirsutella rhossiliensis]KAH0967825.1 sodium/hydrogen exchanger family domain-containing protein [Hirsutella rhossiliensis]
MAGESDDSFLQYHEPGIIQLLILISFFFFLSLAQWASGKIFKAGLIGQIIVGLLYGRPVGNILPQEWQKSFVDLGYIGLILIIFGGGLTVRLDLLKKNFVPSLAAATIGVLTPIGLCYGLLYAGFGYNAVETFIIGAALSTTSLGTTFVVIGRAVKGTDFSQTRIGTILISAAVFDDVSGLIMASIIRNLGSSGSINIGWLIGRPIVASVAMGVASPLLAKFVLGPLFRRYVEHHFVRFKHVSNIVLMVLVLCTFISISAFAGASVLYGSFLAGTFLSSLPCIHPDAPFMVLSREHGETAPGKTPNFTHTFEKYVLGAQTYILEPMFFASIGFAIPFKSLWTGEAVWKGLVFSILMVLGKAVVGAVVPVWEVAARQPREKEVSLAKATWRPATLLGMAMVARGEIGLLIIQIGLNETDFMSKDAFVTAAWAIVLNTILGPVCVGFLLKYHGQTITTDPRWGIQEHRVAAGQPDTETDESPKRRWLDRRYSRRMSQLPSSVSQTTQSSEHVEEV